MRPHGNALLTSHGLFIGPDGGMTVDLDPMRPLHTWTLLVTLKSDDSHQVQDPSVLATLHSQQGREHVSVCTTQVVAPPDQIYSAKSWVATEGGYGHGLLYEQCDPAVTGVFKAQAVWPPYSNGTTLRTIWDNQMTRQRSGTQRSGSTISLAIVQHSDGVILNYRGGRRYGASCNHTKTVSFGSGVQLTIGRTQPQMIDSISFEDCVW